MRVLSVLTFAASLAALAVINPVLAQSGSSMAPRPVPNEPAAIAAQLISAGPHRLTDFELYHLLVGRTFVGQRSNGVRLSPQTFHANGTTIFGQSTGSYRIHDGAVHVSWPDGSKFFWGVRTDGAGRFFTTSGNALHFQ